MTQKVTYPYGEFTLEQLQVTPQHWETLAVAIYKTCVDRFDMRRLGAFVSVYRCNFLVRFHAILQRKGHGV